MKKLVIFLILSTLTITAFGQTSLIPFQARLTDDKNTAVPDNVYNITFKVYDAATGGEPDWTENHINVSVIGGQINVLLGSLEPLTFNFITPKYLGITIGSGPEMVPRHQLVPSFHAQSASLAHESEKLGGKTPDWYASKEHVAQKIADATADLSATLTSTIATVDQHTSQIQDLSNEIAISINDVSSDVEANSSSISVINNRLKSTQIKIYQQVNSYCSGTVGSHTFNSSCSTRSYGSIPHPLINGTLHCYYHCNGSAPRCHRDSFYDSILISTPMSCSNPNLGTVLIE